MMQSVVIILMATATVSTASVVSGGYSTCAMVTNNVRCWGRNDKGQLGLGHITDLHQPQDDAVDFGDFVPSVLDCGYAHCCVIDSDIPGLKCWGNNINGALGYGDTNNRGDGSNEMGNNLPLVELPSGFVPSKLALQSHSTCILSTGGEIVCFGSNIYGNLGLGHRNNIGDQSGEMGENMDLVDVGTDFGVATDLIPGWSHFMCAVNSDGRVKCWGSNNAGQLGLGDTDKRGDGDNEMGNNLDYVQLGTGVFVQSMDCGNKHCCVLSTENVFKCFGGNWYGALGYGDTNHRGDGSNEMGNNLLAVSLGSDFVVQEFGCGSASTCAISTEGQLKCFGYNHQGQLGYGDTVNRGDGSNEMGDNLLEVVVGSGFTASGMRMGGGVPIYSRCIFEDSVSTYLGLKCFGLNVYGELGYGDTNNRGDQYGRLGSEMGDNLPLISFGELPNAECVCEADINSVKDDLTSLQSQVDDLTSLQSQVDKLDNIVMNGRLGQSINSAADAQGANVDETGGMEEETIVTGKDLGIVVLAAINVMMVIAMVIACKRLGGRTKYQPVDVGSDIEPINA